MLKASFLRCLIALSASSVLAACVSPPNLSSTGGARTAGAVPQRAIASSTQKMSTTFVQFHDVEKNDYDVGDLHLKKYPIEHREDRLEFKTKLISTLMRKDDRMPGAAARALTEAIRLLERMDSEDVDPADWLRFQETIEAYNSNFLSPVPRSVWIGAVPYEAIKMIHHSIMNKRAPEAADLAEPPRGSSASLDVSRLDPRPSSFWNPGRREAGIDLYFGFGRSSLPKIDGPCRYVEPKKSYGTHGGFKIDCDGVSWQVKFGNESKTEPFNSRLAWALGFEATPIDYIPEGTRIAYDRRVISEYNSRKSLELKVKSVFGFTYLSKNLQIDLNPFEDGIAGAILNDGSFVKAPVLRKKLLRSIPQKKKRDDWGRLKEATFNDSFEKRIKYLVLREASIEGAPPANEDELGSWSWKSLDHADRRELRAFGLFAAWVNMFDIRQNNNKVILRKRSDGFSELVHKVSDLGSGFGEATNILHYRNGEFNNFPWDLVRLRAGVDDRDRDSNEDGDSDDAGAPGGSLVSSDQAWRTPYKFPHYSVIEGNPAFSRMQLSDAQWMARKLASFTEQQLQDALIASGFTAAETKLVLEKLLDRRQQMIGVFGLADEYPDVMKRRIDRRLNFDPAKDPVPQTKNAAGSTAARKTHQRVVKGRLVD
jgi:hypothetical protein